MSLLRYAAGTLAALLLAFPVGARDEVRRGDPHDAPDPTFARSPARVDSPPSYGDALGSWTSAESLNAWIGANFRYDSERALALSETARLTGTSSAVLTPAAFFDSPRGVCIDLARFAVSVLREIEPRAHAAYLMIEFEPVEISGHVLRRHWLATFKRDGQYYFFADSRRPGHLAGPYARLEEFITEYSAYRGKRIVGQRVLQSHERRVRTPALKERRAVDRY